jgi:hypothetical protein
MHDISGALNHHLHALHNLTQPNTTLREQFTHTKILQKMSFRLANLPQQGSASQLGILPGAQVGKSNATLTHYPCTCGL